MATVTIWTVYSYYSAFYPADSFMMTNLNITLDDRRSKKLQFGIVYKETLQKKSKLQNEAWTRLFFLDSVLPLNNDLLVYFYITRLSGYKINSGW